MHTFFKSANYRNRMSKCLLSHTFGSVDVWISFDTSKRRILDRKQILAYVPPHRIIRFLCTNHGKCKKLETWKLRFLNFTFGTTKKRAQSCLCANLVDNSSVSYKRKSKSLSLCWKSTITFYDLSHKIRVKFYVSGPPRVLTWAFR